MCDMSGNVNTSTVTNMSWVFELDHNLLSTILLTKKDFEVFLKKLGRPLELYFESEVVGLADIIKNQYAVRLAKDPESGTVNMVVSPSIKTLHAQLAHLSYKVIMQQASIALDIQLKSQKICRGCIVGKE